MALINHTIPSLYGGVSQQPSSLRLENQSKEQINVINSVLDGMCKRFPTTWIKDIALGTDSYSTSISFGNDEDYILTCDNSITAPVKLIDKTGYSYPVTYGSTSALEYITSISNKRQNFKAINIKDEIIIINKDKVTEVDVTNTSDATITTNTYEYLVPVTGWSVPTSIVIGGTTYYYVSNTGLLLGGTEQATLKYYLMIDGVLFTVTAGQIYGGVILNTTQIKANFLNQILASALFTGYLDISGNLIVKRKDGNKLTVKECYSYYTEPQIYQQLEGGGSVLLSNPNQRVDYSITENINTATNLIKEPGFIVIKNGLSGVIYYVSIDGVLFTHTATTGASAESVATALNSSINAHADFATQLIGVSILVSRVDGAKPAMSSYSSHGNDYIVSWVDGLNNYADLPNIFFNYYTVKINNTDSNLDDYYTTFVNGSWKESRALGIPHKMKLSTMPHYITKSASSDYSTLENPLGIFFKVQEIPFKERLVGDAESAPFPTFIGDNINDVVVFKNRLTFICDKGVSLSAQGDSFNFFPETTRKLIDTDPIDLEISTNRNAKLKFAVPFSSDLLLFSTDQQFTLTSDNKTLTLATAVINPTTNYQINTNINPIGVSSNLYFAGKNINYTLVREYLLDAGKLTNVADDVTAHVPTYIPIDVNKIVASQSKDMLFICEEGQSSIIYVYMTYWNSNKKIQSAWSKFDMGGTVLNMECIDNKLYLFVDRGERISFEVMMLEKQEVGVLGFDFYLDSKCQTTGVYDSLTGLTTFTLPYFYEGLLGDCELILNEHGIEAKIKEITFNGTTSNIIVFEDYGNQIATFGHRYDMEYILSEITIKEQNGVSNKQGRLQLRNIQFMFNDTGYFKINVTPKGRTTSQKEFSGIILGEDLIGEVNIKDGVYSSLVMGDAENTIIRISNNTYLPTFIQSFNYEGFYTVRSRRF